VDRHLEQDELVLFYYGEHPEQARAEQHLGRCPACLRGFRELEAMLDEATADALPHPPGLEGRVWRAVERELPRRRRRLAPVAAWIAAAAAVAGISFHLGRQSARPADLRQPILAAALSRHLSRARVVLTEVANGGDLAEQRAWAQELLDDNRLYRQTAAMVGGAEQEQLLDDLERALLEIARSSGWEEESLRGEMGQGTLLFRLRATESRENPL
jgi:hypothetical protein